MAEAENSDQSRCEEVKNGDIIKPDTAPEALEAGRAVPLGSVTGNVVPLRLLTESKPLELEEVKTSFDLPKQDSYPTTSKNTQKDEEVAPTSTSLKMKTGPLRSSERVSPYKKRDDLPQFQKLNLSNELCQKRGCDCTKANRPLSEAQLNYARVCMNEKLYSKNVIKEAKLRLHNQQKDQREVIRAARLKINKHYRAKSAEAKLTVTGTASDNKEMFSNIQSKKLLSFGNLAAEAKASKPGETRENSAQKTNFGGRSFQTSRHDALVSNWSAGGRVNDSLDLAQLSSTLPDVQPPVRGAGCAQQALMTPDDLTVEELACYLEDFVYIPRKMSSMAEMMYT